MALPYNPNYSFLHTDWAAADFLILQGSSRSGKTYSVYDFIIWMFNKYPGAGIELDAVRDSLPVLKATILKEFVDRLTELGMYSEAKHNMTDKRIEINGNYFNYYSVDTDLKARGRKRHILWLNEPNNINFNIVKQLLIRTTNKVIIDFNPSEPEGMEHWLYDDIMNRPKARKLITSYKDNPHLSAMQVAEIEQYAVTDPNFFEVFGKGLRGAGRKGQIFTHWQKCDVLPNGPVCYGLDFGKTNDPTCLAKVVSPDVDTIYCDELIYQTNLTTSEIVKIMKQAGVGSREPIYADSAEPLMIREIKEAGFNVLPCVKGAGSVSGGINKIKSLNVFATKNSRNLWREYQWYAWKLDASGNATNEPIDLHNHGMDAIRYSMEGIRPTPKRHRPSTGGAYVEQVR